LILFKIENKSKLFDIICNNSLRLMSFDVKKMHEKWIKLGLNESTSVRVQYASTTLLRKFKASLSFKSFF